MSTPICPECAAGKHPNCDGTAWDTETDQPSLCSCPALDHPRQRLSCGCLLVVASRTMLEPCTQHHTALGPVSVDAELPQAEEPVRFPWEDR